MDILVRQNFTQEQVTAANVKRAEFRRNRYTSGSAHLDDMIELGKAIVLCDSHAQKFKPRVAHYELHPAKNMRRVQGNCDVCRDFGPATLFLHESQAVDERRKNDNYRRCSEYAHVVAN